MTAPHASDIPALRIASGKTTLTREEPAVRLGIADSNGGALIIAGATNAYVEDTGLTAVQIGGDFRAPGRRRLASKRGRDIVVHLDRVKLLRRVAVAGDSLVIVTDTGGTILVPGAAHVGIHVVTTTSDTGKTVSTPEGPDRRLLRVHRHIEIRRDDATGPLADAYGMDVQD